MRDDINDMFMEKNFEILKNKINLDMDNNADSLNHTISNFIDLKEITINRYLMDLYDGLNIKYKENVIKDFVSKEAEKLKSISLDCILLRKEKIAEYFDKKVDYRKIDDSYIEEFHKYIDSLTDVLENDINLKIRDEVCTKFSPELSKLYKLPDEDSQEMIINYINDFYCDTIIDKIKNEVQLRNGTLKNLSLEAFERFKSMNEKTVE
ncbi:MAG: hypothetical protein IKQ35_01070 [Bacilli bacterium]|nr:hypothetical protein [Bacilli bacterium]